jgi:hypothetical protein
MMALSQVLVFLVYAALAYAKTVSYDFSVGYVTVRLKLPLKKSVSIGTILIDRRLLLMASQDKLLESTVNGLFQSSSVTWATLCQ